MVKKLGVSARGHLRQAVAHLSSFRAAGESRRASACYLVGIHRSVAPPSAVPQPVDESDTSAARLRELGAPPVPRMGTS